MLGVAKMVKKPRSLAEFFCRTQNMPLGKTHEGCICKEALLLECGLYSTKDYERLERAFIRSFLIIVNYLFHQA